MADNAFDDQYVGCTEEMDRKAPEMLKEELEANENFKNEWKQAADIWNRIKNQEGISKKLNDFHGTALVAFTQDTGLKFNKAVKEFRENSHNFTFRAFHYYLTRALQLLNQGDCYTVYRRSVTKLHYNGTGNVRFGQFTVSYLSKRRRTSPFHFSKWQWVFFEITTCLGVPVKDYSYHPREEVLIPGYEVYQKVNVTEKEKYIEIRLENPQNQQSNYNCFYSGLKCNNPDCFYRSLGTRERPTLPILLPSLLLLLFPTEEQPLPTF